MVNIMFSCLHIFNCLLCCLISISGHYELVSIPNERSAVSVELSSQAIYSPVAQSRTSRSTAASSCTSCSTSVSFQSGTDALGAAPEDSSALERAVSARALILEKPSRSGGCLHAYEPLDTLFSSTPDGYEPFYISHFGRHGSRFAGSREDFAVIDELMKYSSRVNVDSLNGLYNYSKENADSRKSSAGSSSTSAVAAESRKMILSETGEQLLSDLIALKEYSEGKYGQLTEKGAREHRNISRRMYSHYPQVFSNPERKRVIAVSTTSGRTIASKENFLSQLDLNAPDLEVSSYTARDTLEYPAAVLATSGYPMSKEVRRNERFPDTSESTARLMKGFDSRRLRSLLFVSNNDDSLMASNGRDTVLCHGTLLSKASLADTIDDSIFIRIQFSGRHYECIGDTLVPNFEKYFTAEELYYLWTVETLIWYAHSCACEGADHTRMHYYGAGILRTIIDEADSAIAGNSVAANLRFSHDTYLYPLLALMGVEGADYQGPAIGALDRVIDFTNVCTAGNVQLIFYKKQAAQANQPDVLVKILKNEKEVLIPSLAPSTGCYYDWQRLKEYFIQRITMF